MEDDESISVHVPSFARGLNLLLIDDTASSLLYLSLLLEQYTFKVTAIEEVSMAKSIICNHEGYFRLVMVKLNMLGKDVFSFLDFFHEKDIPVVFISSGGLEDVIWKALAKGLCYFFEEPILFEDLKYLWKHAYHSKHRSTKEAQYANKAAGENEETKIDNDDHESNKQRGKRVLNFDNPNHMVKETKERKGLKIGHSKKNHFVWTPELHQKFTEAVSFLGGYKTARPIAILNFMNVPNLTTRHITSHKQKCILKLNRNQTTNSPDSSSNITDHKTKLPTMLGSSSYQGFLKSTVPLNVSQQDLFATGFNASTYSPLNLSQQDLFATSLSAANVPLDVSQQNQFASGFHASTSPLNMSQQDLFARSLPASNTHLSVHQQDILFSGLPTSTTIPWI